MAFEICGLCCEPYLVRNPHPDAGKPEALLTVGAEYVCVPCTVKAMHGWASRALTAEAEVERLREQVAR